MSEDPTVHGRAWGKFRRFGLGYRVPNEDFARRRTMSGLGGVFSQVARTVTRDAQCKVHIHDDPSAPPAWSDGREIHINVRDRSVTEVTIGEFIGHNEHEMLHLLHTPRAASELGAWAIQQGIQNSVFNILEDQRIERMGIYNNPSTRPWLQYTVLKEIMLPGLRGDACHYQYLLLVGRFHVPVRFRRAYRRMFRKFLVDNGHDLALADELKQLTFAYLPLVFPKDNAKAIEIMTRYKEIYEELFGNSGAPPSGSTCAIGSMSGGAPMDPDEQRPAPVPVDDEGPDTDGLEQTNGSGSGSGADVPAGDGPGGPTDSELDEDACPCGCGIHTLEPLDV